MSTRRHHAGKANWLVVGGLAGFVAVAILFAFAGESPEAAGARFMNALIRGDVKTLTDMSYAVGADKSELEKQWDFAVNVAAPYYKFSYTIVSSVAPNDESAFVRMRVFRNLDRGSAFEEKFELPLVRKGGNWQVDIRSLDRRLYPQMPRG